MAYVETVQLGFYVELYVLGIEPKDLPLIGKHYLSFILRLLRAFDKRSVMRACSAHPDDLCLVPSTSVTCHGDSSSSHIKLWPTLI